MQKKSGADGIEVVYPSEFRNVREIINVIKESGIPISALNLNVKSEKRWERGSITNGTIY